MQQEPHTALAATAGSHAATGPAAARSAPLDRSCCMDNHDSSESHHTRTHLSSQRKDVQVPSRKQVETQQIADLRPARVVNVSETSDKRPPCFLALAFLESTAHETVLTCSCTIAFGDQPRSPKPSSCTLARLAVSPLRATTSRVACARMQAQAPPPAQGRNQHISTLEI